MKQKNLVIFKGTIVRMEVSTKLALCKIATDGSGESVFPVITFYDPKVLEGYNIKDRVTILAHIQNRPVRDRNGVRKYYVQDIVADHIEKTPRMLQSYLSEDVSIENDGGVQLDENQVILIGKVSHTFELNDAVTIITVSVPSGKFFTYCNVTCFRRQAQTVKNLEIGNFVAISGHIQVRRIKKEGQEIDTQSVLCRDIAKVPDEKIE